MKRWPLPLQLAVVALGYFLAAEVGLWLNPGSPTTAVVWPSSGVGLAAVIVLGPRIWPAIAAGAFLANVATLPIPVAALIAIGDTVEPILAGWILSRVAFDSRMARVGDVLALIAVAVTCTPISATLTLVSLKLAGAIPEGHLLLWRELWLADALGSLVVTPLLLTMGSWHMPARIVEIVLLGACVIGVTSFVFCVEPTTLDPFRMSYVVFPPIVWAAMRFQQRGTTLATFLVCFLAWWSTTHGRGPFAHPQVDLSLMSLQLFITVMSGTGLILSAVIAERQRITMIIRMQHRENELLLRKAEDAVRMRDEFLSVASHELRTPLSVLVLQLETLYESLRSPVRDEAKLLAKVERARRSTSRLTMLIDRLLDVSRASKAPCVQREHFDLVAMVRSVIGGFAGEAERSGVSVTLDAPPTLEGDWDRARLEQALSNLLSNAIKYGHGHPVEIGIHEDDGHVVLEVRDHGIGIEESDLERIFVRFERAAPKEQYGGLGLGLSLARQIVEAHGGTVRASSDPARGTIFTMELPR